MNAGQMGGGVEANARTCRQRTDGGAEQAIVTGDERMCGGAQRPGHRRGWSWLIDGHLCGRQIFIDLFRDGRRRAGPAHAGTVPNRIVGRGTLAAWSAWPCRQRGDAGQSFTVGPGTRGEPMRLTSSAKDNNSECRSHHPRVCRGP